MNIKQKKRIFSMSEMIITLAGIITGDIPIAIAAELAEPAYEYLMSRKIWGDDVSDDLREQYIEALKETFSRLKSTFNNDILQDISSRLEFQFDKQTLLTPESIRDAIRNSVKASGEVVLSERLIEKIYSEFTEKFIDVVSEKSNSLNAIVVKSRIDELQINVATIMKELKELKEQKIGVKSNNTYSFFDGISQDKFHYNIFNTDVDIEKCFLDGNYEILDFENHQCGQHSAVVESCLNILNEQRYLFIQGEYGSGKTMLMKIIQRRVASENYRTIYLHSTDFYRLLNQKVDLDQEFRSLNERTYIFVDALDELIGITMNGNTDMVTIIGMLSNALKYNNVYIVINSRPNVLYDGESMPMSELIYFGFSGGNNRGLLVSMSVFKNPVIDMWLSEFLGGDYLTTTILKKSYKKILTSCRIPLFVYFLGLEYKQSRRVLDDVLLYYEKYIDSTITGKYNKELKQSMALMGLSMPLYRNLLRRIAFEVCSKCEYTPDEEEVNINYPYFFDFDQLSDVAKLSLVSKSDASNWIPNILNCYFFKVFETENTKIICFSDYNVMCFLAAEYLFERIKTFLGDCADNVENRVDELKEIDYIKLNPVVMDTLMIKMLRLDSGQINSILFNIKSIIAYCIEDNISSVALNIQILLFIIYFKLNEGVYSEDADRYFTYFECLCKMYKLGHPNNRFLEERYFMNTKFYNYSINNFNCTDYNFKNSAFRKFEFESSYFERSILENIELREVKFMRSHFIHSTLTPKIMKSVEANNCTFYDFAIMNRKNDNSSTENKSKTMNFFNCQICNVTIEGMEGASFNLENCVIENLCIRRCRKLSICIENCLLVNDVNVYYTSGILNSSSNDISSKITRHGTAINDFKIEISSPTVAEV